MSKDKFHSAFTSGSKPSAEGAQNSGDKGKESSNAPIVPDPSAPRLTGPRPPAPKPSFAMPQLPPPIQKAKVIATPPAVPKKDGEDDKDKK